jgi:hypothetical protein
VLRGGPDGARVLVDGEPVARLPAAPFEICPGERRIDVRLGERGVWSRDVVLAESEEGVLEVEPRPNVVLVGADTWPEDLAVFDGKFNRTVQDAGAPTGDLSRSETWDALAWPTDADLVLAQRATRDGAPGWWLYSPVLRLVAPLDARTLEAIEARPRWTGVAWGLALVDSLRRGPALVARVTEGGPAAQAGLRPGDRLISLGGSQVADAARARQILGIATSRVPLDAEWLSPDGTARRGKIQGIETPLLDPGPPDPVAGMVRAAWARVDEACDPEAAPLAMANRALLLSTHGRHALAVRAWRRVVLPERAGIGQGTVQYHLGRDLQRTGAEEAAAQAHRAAAASEATALSDEGPRLAPAARDHLADLGVF